MGQTARRAAVATLVGLSVIVAALALWLWTQALLGKRATPAVGEGGAIYTTTNDGTTWTSIYSTTNGKGGVESFPVNGSGRYVRFYGTARGTGYGYSLWELEVHGTVTKPTTAPLLSGPVSYTHLTLPTTPYV